MTEFIHVFFIVVFYGFFALGHGCPSKYGYTHFLDINPSYKLCWKFLTATNEIEFRTEVYTSGWFGFGISETGRMSPADVVMGYVAPWGAYVFSDYFSDSKSHPKYDDIQNWYVVNASHINNLLAFDFGRALDTKDRVEDIVISAGPTNIIWAYSNIKPTSPYDFQKHQNRGNIRIDLNSDLFLIGN